MPKPNTVLESMTRLEVCGRVIRIWRDEKNLSYIDNSDLETHADKIRAAFAPGAIGPTSAELLKGFAAFNRVSAVEVLNENGCGLLLYPDWN